MSSLEREADIKREIYLYMLLSGCLCSTKEDPHGSGTYGFRGGNSEGNPRSHINNRISSSHEYFCTIWGSRKASSQEGCYAVGQSCCHLEMALQDQVWICWKCWKVQGKIRCLGGRYRLWWHICTCGTIYHHPINHSPCCYARMESSSDDVKTAFFCMVW